MNLPVVRGVEWQNKGAAYTLQMSAVYVQQTSPKFRVRTSLLTCQRCYRMQVLWLSCVGENLSTNMLLRGYRRPLSSFRFLHFNHLPLAVPNSTRACFCLRSRCSTSCCCDSADAAAAAAAVVLLIMLGRWRPCVQVSQHQAASAYMRLVQLLLGGLRCLFSTTAASTALGSAQQLQQLAVCLLCLPLQ